jgi:hypothetical protein
MIIAKHSTWAVSTVDASGRGELGKFRPDNLPESLMVSLFVIMQDELRGGSAQGRLAEQNQSVQTGFLDAPNKSFREGIQVR